MLYELTDDAYVGFSREDGSRRMLDVCRIAAQTGQTMLAADHLSVLAKIVRHHEKQMAIVSRALDRNQPWTQHKRSKWYYSHLEALWPEPESPFRQLSARAAHALRNDNLLTAEQVRGVTDDYLLGIPNFGAESLAVVRRVFGTSAATC